MKLFLTAFIALFAVICATYGIYVTDSIVFELVLTIIAMVGGVLGWGFLLALPAARCTTILDCNQKK